MPKEKRKIVESSSSQRRVCEVRTNGLARRVTDDVLQHSLYPTPVVPTSGGASVLARSERRQRQEPKGAPYLASPPTSVENEESSTSLQEV